MIDIMNAFFPAATGSARNVPPPSALAASSIGGMPASMEKLRARLAALHRRKADLLVERLELQADERRGRIAVRWEYPNSVSRIPASPPSGVRRFPPVVSFPGKGKGRGDGRFRYPLRRTLVALISHAQTEDGATGSARRCDPRILISRSRPRGA